VTLGGGSPATVTASAALTLGRNYWTSFDGQADAATYGGVGDLVSWLKTVLDQTGRSFTQTVSAAGILTITVDSGEFTLDFSAGATTLDGALFGFAAASYTSSSSSIVAPLQMKGWFAPGRPVSEDSRDRQPYVGSVAFTMDGTTRASRMTAPHKEREIAWRNMPQRYSLAEFANAAEPTGTAEHAWSEALSLGRRVRVYPDLATLTAGSYSLYTTRDLEDPIARSGINLTRWDFALNLSRADYT